MRLLCIVLLLICFNPSFSQDTVKVAQTLTPEQQAEEDYNKGLASLRNKDFNTSVELFSKCILVKPLFDKAFSNRAVAYSQLNKTTEALNDVNAAIKINPQNPDNFFNKNLIFAMMNLKDSQQVALDNCLRLNGEHAQAAYYKGMLAFENGDYDKSIGYYSVAILSDKKYVYAYNDRASAKREKGDAEGAIADYLQAIALDSSLAFIYNNLGSAYRLNKNYPQAIAAYSKAYKLNPQYWTALLNRGNAHFENNEFKPAQADFEEAIAVDPKNAFAYNNLASIALKNKDYKKAKDLASRSIELDPKNGPAYYNRGIARQLLREEEQCCADWKKALELGVLGAKVFINTNCSY